MKFRDLDLTLLAKPFCDEAQQFRGSAIRNFATCNDDA